MTTIAKNEAGCSSVPLAREVGRLEILDKLGNAMTGYAHVCGLPTLDSLLVEAAETIELWCSWEADAQARAELLEQHLRAVLEVAMTWKPDYATTMDRDTLRFAQECVDRVPPNAQVQAASEASRACNRLLGKED